MRTLAAGVIAIFMAVTGFATAAQAAAPSPGTCFSYSADQWIQTTFTASVVDCATSHNGEVLAQVEVPPDIAATGYGSSTMTGWAFNACQPLAVDYIWSPSATANPLYPKSSFVMPRSARLNVQLPTPEAWGSGQRWAACLGQSRNVKLTAPQARTGSVKSLGLKPYVCLNPRNWKGRNCASRDAVRLTNQVWLATDFGQAYPGTKSLLNTAAKACEDMRLKKWSLRTWYIPGLGAWERGNKYGFCEFLKKR